MVQDEMTPFEKFKVNAESDIDTYRQRMVANGQFEFRDCIKELISFQNKVSYFTFERMFGIDLGSHLWDKFVKVWNRNALNFLASLNSEYQFYILYEIKTGKIWY